jgi:hypothetical protein
LGAQQNNMSLHSRSVGHFARLSLPIYENHPKLPYFFLFCLQKNSNKQFDHVNYVIILGSGLLGFSSFSLAVDLWLFFVLCRGLSGLGLMVIIYGDTQFLSIVH